jgi:putative endopeptidase
MDTIAIDKNGYTPLKPMLSLIDAVKDYRELLNLLADHMKDGDGDLIGYYVGADEKNSSKNILVLMQTGLSLPAKEYYTKTDSSSVRQRAKLVENAAKYFTLTGTDAATAAKNAQSILALETEIAKSHLTPVEQRDPIRNYNKMTVANWQNRHRISTGPTCCSGWEFIQTALT